MKNEFYIGYIPKAPKTLAKWLRKIMIALLVLFALVSVFVASSQDRFAQTNFEYGQYTQLKGIVSLKPVPRLIVNFGKSGVIPLFQNIEKTTGKPITDLEFTLNGTLIYGEGKVVFELTDQQASILDYTPLNQSYYQPRTKELGEQSVYGEIIDPKCYFGVMKPGFGKVHRSCAIRCIAGGITPVMLTTNKNGDNQFILLTPNNNLKDVHHFPNLAGKKLTIRGHLSQLDDWLILTPQELKSTHIHHQNPLTSYPPPDTEITTCN